MNNSNSCDNDTIHADKQSIRDEIKETGEGCITSKDQNGNSFSIHLMSIIGEIEGHDNLPNQSKATKYEHLIPKLALLCADSHIDGILIIVNTTGGNVECGLAIAEMIASVGKPTVSLVIGDGHSIGVPVAVASDYTFIAPSASMMIHPVRTSGMTIGVIQSYRNTERVQNRITRFISDHSNITQGRLEEIMLSTDTLVKDVGTLLESQCAVSEGLIDEIGGISQAYAKLKDMIFQHQCQKNNNQE